MEADDPPSTNWLRWPELRGDEALTSDATARGTRHKVGWGVASGALVVVLALVALLIWRPWEAKSPAKRAVADLALNGLTAEVSPSAGGCGTKFVFTGKVVVSGGSGQLTYQWIKPDGATTDPTTGTVEPGRRTYTPNLEYTLRGPGHLSGEAVLIVSKPVQLRSAPVHIEYLC